MTDSAYHDNLYERSPRRYDPTYSTYDDSVGMFDEHGKWVPCYIDENTGELVPEEYVTTTTTTTPKGRQATLFDIVPYQRGGMGVMPHLIKVWCEKCGARITYFTVEDTELVDQVLKLWGRGSERDEDECPKCNRLGVAVLEDTED